MGAKGRGVGAGWSVGERMQTITRRMDGQGSTVQHGERCSASCDGASPAAQQVKILPPAWGWGRWGFDWFSVGELKSHKPYGQKKAEYKQQKQCCTKLNKDFKNGTHTHLKKHTL